MYLRIGIKNFRIEFGKKPIQTKDTPAVVVATALNPTVETPKAMHAQP